MTKAVEKLLLVTCERTYKLNILDTEIVLNFALSEARHISDITVEQYVWFTKFFDEIIQSKKEKAIN